jgi:DNA end-binding protein Ku
MPRPIWTGSLSFGLVNVPVRLMSATRDLGVHFNQLHEKDGSRIEVRRVCTEENVEVPWEEVGRGYELESGEIVMLTDEELEAADPKKTRTIDIEAFVDLEEIDPVFYDHPYYLVPDSNEAAVRAYHLLRSVMERSGQVAIARFVLRTKEYLVAVRTRGDAITLTTMLFHDEVRSAEDVDIDGLPKAKKAEVDQAVTLVTSLQRDFDPANYEDEHRKRLLAIIEKKKKGQEIEIPDEPETPKAVPDLMAALEASIQRMKTGGREALAADADSAEQDPAAALKRLPKKDLLARAKEAEIEGRSQMSKDELVEALTAS